jgi:hypothetical protein
VKKWRSCLLPAWIRSSPCLVDFSVMICMLLLLIMKRKYVHAGDDISNMQIPKFPQPSETSLKIYTVEQPLGIQLEKGLLCHHIMHQHVVHHHHKLLASHTVLCLIVFLIVHCDIHMYHRTKHHMSLIDPHNPTKHLIGLGTN